MNTSRRKVGKIRKKRRSAILANIWVQDEDKVKSIEYYYQWTWGNEGTRSSLAAELVNSKEKVEVRRIDELLWGLGLDQIYRILLMNFEEWGYKIESSSGTNELMEIIGEFNG